MDAGPAADAATSTWAPVAAAVSALTVEWFQPFNVVLILAVLLFIHFLWRAARSPGFNIFDSLRDEAGKISQPRIAYYGVFIFSTWMVMQCAASWLQQPHEFFLVFALYVLAFALPKVLESWIKAKYGGAGDATGGPKP